MILCGHEGKDYGKGPFARWFKFEVRVDNCGVKLPRKSGVAHYVDCFKALVTHTGIDIVFRNIVPIELKLGRKTYKESQLVRYCRFAANGRLHVAIYAYAKFPNDHDNFHEAASRSCWSCWTNTALKLCPKGGGTGSIYVAFGGIANKAGKRFYVNKKTKGLCR